MFPWMKSDFFGALHPVPVTDGVSQSGWWEQACCWPMWGPVMSSSPFDQVFPGLRWCPHTHGISHSHLKTGAPTGLPAFSASLLTELCDLTALFSCPCTMLGHSPGSQLLFHITDIMSFAARCPNLENSYFMYSILCFGHFRYVWVCVCGWGGYKIRSLLKYAFSGY